MKAQKEQHNWKALVDLFNTRNQGRPTRLGVLSNPPDAMEDYWLEDGLPLAGVDVDTHADGTPSIEIMLGDERQAESRRLTHVVTNARSLKFVVTALGDADGLEVEGEDGKTTVLRFES